MYLCIWEIRQPSGMVEMQMRQDDVMHVLRVVSHPVYLADKSQIRVPYCTENIHEIAHHARRVGIIVETKSGIDQQETLVRIDKQAYRTNLLIWRPGKGFGKTIEKLDCHGAIMPYLRFATPVIGTNVY